MAAGERDGSISKLFETNSGWLAKKYDAAGTKTLVRFLRDLSPRFVRQKPLAHYIADFYCPTRKLVIEVDGGQHYEPENRENDEWRTQTLNQMGIRVIRFTNSDVDCHFNEVCASILAILKAEGL